MIDHQNRPVDGGEALDAPEMKTGAEILRLVLEYEQMIHRGASRTEAAHQLAMKTSSGRTSSRHWWRSIRMRKTPKSAGAGSRSLRRG